MAAITAGVVAAAAAVLVGLGVIGTSSAPEHEPAISGALVGISPQTGLTERDYNRLEDAGVGIVRVPLNWEAVQLAPGECEPVSTVGTCHWSEADVAIGNAAEHGARVLPILSNVPGWAAKRSSTPPLNGELEAGWRDFLQAAVERYGPGGEFWRTEYTVPPFAGGGPAQPITEWQVWNEPNGKVYFHPHPNPRKYAHLVELSADALREVDPGAEIVLGGMFGTAEIELPRFMRQMYAVDGVKDSFDAIAVHPYSTGLRDLKLQIRWALREARRAGDANTGLWVTELGWGSGKGTHPLEKGKKGQARLLGKSMELFRRNSERWNVEGVIWFTWQDRRDKTVCKFCRHAGLFDPDGDPKPAWDVFKREINPE